MGGKLGTTLDSLVEEFNSQHAEIRIVATSVGNYGALAQKLMASVMAGKPPVIAQSYESWTDQFREAGAIVPLNSFVNSDAGYTEVEINDYFTPIWNNNIWGDTIWSMPFNKSLGVVFYNYDYFDSLGTGFPSTWENMLGACSVYSSPENELYAFAMPSNTWFFETALFQRGGALLEETNGEVFFDDSLAVSLLEELKKLTDEERICYLGSGYQSQDEFVTGRTIISWGSVVSYSYMMKKNPSFRIGVSTLPPPTGGKDVSVIAGTNIIIFSKSSPEQQVAAWEFIKWFNSPEVQAVWAINTGYIPTRRSSLRIEEMVNYLSEIPGSDEVYRKIDWAVSEPKIGAWFSGRIYLSQAIEYTLRGVMPADQSLKMASEKLRHDISESF